MRILHTSDWHIGRSFHGHATLDALRGVLATLGARCASTTSDVVIVAGDVSTRPRRRPRATPCSPTSSATCPTRARASSSRAATTIRRRDSVSSPRSCARASTSSPTRSRWVPRSPSTTSTARCTSTASRSSNRLSYGTCGRMPHPIAAADDRPRDATGPRRPGRSRRPVGGDRALLRAGCRCHTRGRAESGRETWMSFPLRLSRAPTTSRSGRIHGRQKVSERCGTRARRCTTASARPTAARLVAHPVGCRRPRVRALARPARAEAPRDDSRHARELLADTEYAAVEDAWVCASTPTPPRRPTRCAGCRRGSPSAPP